ncbi:hypothetical protein PMZ80_007564 [Knufia obscura]|uniref:1,3-beta-glucanosyltransferase n=2 Tax=Knufia TaxID=430999 RepID=A0AAN8I4I3_9EURO|nr:hypothetical protein PMZ80_007564 [Knufia obscura]KAK5954107.1 hypothetical protein OHC33_004679 [Knufia fluminis]
MASFNLIAILLAAVLAITVQSIPTISVTGSKFFTSEGKQFYIKGVAYQLVENDPLVDTAQCQRDATLMQQLGANSIRVYHVDPAADHNGCMNAFAQAGIYIWVDLDSFKTYIRLGDGPSWTQNKSDSFRAIMDNFQQYDNTAGFFVGNEVLNDITDSSSAPYLLSATVDLRAYGKSKGYRPIPIGYSATDTGALPMLADYLVCRENPEERLDFYALNSYRWCGQSTFETSGYNIILNSTENYPVPIFFSEVGCNTVAPRDFGDQAAVFGPMADQWSGSIIYEWIQEMNQYGLVSYGPQQDASVNEGSSIVQGFTRQGTPTPIAPDFDNLKNQWATLSPTGIDSAAYAATVQTTAPACPASTAGTSAWTIDPRAALPTMDAAAISGMTSGSSFSVPSGGITVPNSSGPSTTNAPGGSQTLSGEPSNLPSSGGNSATPASGSGSASGSASATSQAAGSRTVPMPVEVNEALIIRTFLAIAGVSLGAMVLL